MNYIIKILFACIVFGYSNSLFSQNLGNEWINLDQQYYRFSITKTGMHRIYKNELQDAGVPIGNNDPQQIQLYFKGKEIPCYIEGESIGDVQFIEFYAEKNNGWFDAQMYNAVANQVNPHYSLINDTASVFLTWGSSLINQRYQAQNNQNFNGFNPLPYCFNNKLTQYTNYYRTGQTQPADCEYTAAEGWVDNEYITKGKTVTKTIVTPNMYASNINSEIEWALITFSKGDHHLRINGAGINIDTSFYGLVNIKNTYTTSSSNLSESNEFSFTSVGDNSSATDFSTLSFIRIKYPMNFNFQDKKTQQFSIPASTALSYVEISGFNTNSSVVIFDITNNKRILTSIENEVVKALFPASTQETELVIINSNYFNSISEIRQSQFFDHSNGNKDYLIITHKSLMSAVEDYKAYRNAYVADIDNLYDQFAYGIQKHPLSIRNFITYIQNQWDIKPKHLFLIGKGVAAYVDNVYPGYRTNSGSYSNCLIPPMGYPASDVLLVAKTDGVTPTPALPIGRLSAQTPKQVSNYLAKVQEFESNEPAEWMKRAIHFGGGSTTSEQQLFSNYLSNYEKYFEDTIFGGQVSTFLKTSSDPIVITKSDSIERLINEGVSIMTFFGHGTTNGFDQNIDEPSAFLNFGKYPLLIANSCYSGNIFMPGPYSNSENWTLIANKGVIGYLAVTHEGIAQFLDIFTNTLYKNLSRDEYGKSIGNAILSAREKAYEMNSGDYARNAFQEFTLHGDPAVVLNSFSKPDLVIENSSISFSPTVVTTQVDSFDFNIVLKNISRAVTDTFAVNISRSLQNGSIIDTQLFINGLKYKKNISIRFATDVINGTGLNNFFVSVDANSIIDELSESNNSITISTYILSTELITTVPYNYGLIPTSPQNLKALTGDPFANNSTSTFQLDTSYLFNSPFLISQDINHEGGVIEWEPSTFFIQNKIYYWRAGKNKTKGEETWSTSSFCFQNNKYGWLQGDFGQIKDNQFNFLQANASTNKIEFITTPKRLSCHNIGSPWKATYNDIKFAIDEITDYSSCGASSAILLVVIDTLNLQPWKSDKGDFGHINYPKCSSRSRPDLYYVYPVSTGAPELWDMINMVNEQVPDGFHILIYSFNKIAFHTWSEGILQSMEAWGANNIRFQADNTPYIFYTQKGNITSADEVIGNSETEEIDFSIDLKTNFVYGNISSTIIGPSQHWEVINWQAEKEEVNPNETFHLNVNGVNQAGERITLMDSLTINSVDISDISSEQYPYLQLDFHTKDEDFKTPTQLKNWSVEYMPITDLAINPLKGFEFYSDTLPEGEKGRMSIAIENIGPVNSDKILVEYWLQNSSNEKFPLANHQLDSLASGEVLIDTISFETINHAGLMSLWVNVNPVVETNNSYDQPEQNHFNNIASRVFYVQSDQNNPLLDVTFDGLHIMDGDIVSARPKIVIQLKDENPYIVLNDTSSFEVYLKSSQTSIEEKLSISSNPQITFIPGELPKNKAQLIYEPEFYVDGTYELRVRAKDVTGNESGAYDYHISFQVINESTITNVFNYPNPFSTSTRFVFELTGSEIPDEIRIDILTVTGRVIKSIYQSDLGILNIGRNISDYAWDGRDNFGDPLANGVYFYKVSVRLNGEELKHRDTGTSKFFKNGFGKMYIMR